MESENFIFNIKTVQTGAIRILIESLEINISAKFFLNLLMSLRVQLINGFCPNFNIFLFFNLIEFFLAKTNANILFFNW